MNKTTLGCLLLISLVAALSSCKLVVMVPSGGDVLSLSDTRNCWRGDLCEFDMSDADFRETFTAVPTQGYVFSKWQVGEKFQCGDSTDPDCVVSNLSFAGIQAILEIIASGELYYLMPVFEFVGIDTDSDRVKNHLDEDDDNDGVLDGDDVCPTDPDPSCALITDTVFVNGKEWAQVDLFRNLSWRDIDAICTGGPCADNGMLNGHDMTGWTWASVDEVHEYLNYYSGGDPTLSGLEYYYVESDSEWISFIFDDGMRPTETGTAESLKAWTKEIYESQEGLGRSFHIYNRLSAGNDSVYLGVQNSFNRLSDTGGWFYRVP